MIRIYIDGTEVLCDKNIIIEEEMLNTPSVILNNVFPKSWENDKDYVSNFYYPPDYSKCLIYEETPRPAPSPPRRDLLFAGIVRNTGDISLNPRYPHYCSVQVLDFKDFLSQGETLDFVLTDITVEDAIKRVVSTISGYGFMLGNIDIIGGDDIIGAYSTLEKTAYDVFNYLADITQSKWTTRVLNDNEVAIDFYDPSLMPEGTAIDYTTQFFEDYGINDMSFSYSTNDYRNKQVMTSDEVYGTIQQSQTLVANGYQTEYMTEQKIGQIEKITVNGVEKTFITKTEKDLGQVADFYYSVGDNTFESDSTLNAGQVIVICYTPIIKGRQTITNSTEINRVATATGRKGVVARYENRNDATTSNELQKIGQAYIQYKGTPEILLTIESTQNTWNIGEVVQFNAPIDELDTTYLVKSKTIHIISTVDTVFYTYEMSSNFNTENAINYFDNQRAKNNGNIGEGEYIDRNIDIENTANIIFQDRTIEEVTPVGDNELNCELNSPFIV